MESFLLKGSPLSIDRRWSSVRFTIRFLVTSLVKALWPWTLRFARCPTLGRVLVVPNLPFMDNMRHCAQLSQFLFVPFASSVPQSNPVLEVCRQVLGLHDLVCSLENTINYEMSRKICALPIQVQSTDSATCGLQSSCRNILNRISSNRMHLVSVLSVMAKTDLFEMNSALLW